MPPARADPEAATRPGCCPRSPTPAGIRIRLCQQAQRLRSDRSWGRLPTATTWYLDVVGLRRGGVGRDRSELAGFPGLDGGLASSALAPPTTMKSRWQAWMISAPPLNSFASSLSTTRVRAVDAPGGVAPLAERVSDVEELLPEAGSCSGAGVAQHPEVNRLADDAAARTGRSRTGRADLLRGAEVACRYRRARGGLRCRGAAGTRSSAARAR